MCLTLSNRQKWTHWTAPNAIEENHSLASSFHNTQMTDTAAWLPKAGSPERTDCLRCFGATGWMQKEHSACKNWVIRCWRDYLSHVGCKWFPNGPSDANATWLSPASFKSRMVYLSSAGLHRFTWQVVITLICCLAYPTASSSMICDTLFQPNPTKRSSYAGILRGTIRNGSKSGDHDTC